MNLLFAVQWPFSDNFVERAGWVLVHSLWQFVLLGLLASVLMRLMRRSSAEARSSVLIGLLVLSIVFPIATWMLQSSGPSPRNRILDKSEADKPRNSAAAGVRSFLVGV